MVNDLDYADVKFPVSEKDCKKKKKKNVCINVFCYENNLIHPVHVSIKNLRIAWICC